MDKIKKTTSTVINRLLLNPYKSYYRKEYYDDLKHVACIRDKTKCDKWVDMFQEDILGSLESLLIEYKQMSKDEKKCTDYTIKQYKYWYKEMKSEDIIDYKLQLYNINSNNEELGKTFEMSLCKLYNIKYNGKYKYKEDDDMVKRLSIIKGVIPDIIEHIGKVDKYDFKTTVGYLSAKTTKTSDKICPQVIGQPTKKKFCKYFNLPETSSNEDIKQYIINNVDTLLDEYIFHTFHCGLLYYDTLKDKVLYINKYDDIKFNKTNLSFSRKLEEWNESTTLKYEGKTIGEFQIHNHRSGIKYRWNIGCLLDHFKGSFEVLSF